ncbi:DgyrCDS380 [Dimorphilus gyrociliatus]|uniref:DgyrCDS380 n=1 Tax=Dimorphilus gyrociliatus TaxID=2664684 RepID=A0A7I8V668_9ANNE|nr:DgyrCDS380 [Dimorphilus gyrociliatus]
MGMAREINNINYFDWIPEPKGSENPLINTELDINMSIVEQMKLKKNKATFISIPFKEPLDYQTEKNSCLLKINLPTGMAKFNQTYCCKTCKLLFTSLFSCQCHLVLEHNDKAIKQKIFKDLRKMKKECFKDKKYSILKVGLGQLVQCSLCERQTLLEKNSPMQRSHDKFYHSVTAKLVAFNCKKCKRKFRSSTLVKNHTCSVIKLRRHKNERNFCASCDLSFPDARSLRVHTRNVHVKKLTEQAEPKQPLTMFVDNNKDFKDHKSTPSKDMIENKRRLSNLENDCLNEIFNDENTHLPMPIKKQKKFQTNSGVIETIIS